MGDWSQIEGARLDAEGIDTANSRGTTCTASATLNTKGAWAQLVASTPQEVAGFWLLAQRHGSGNTDYLVDLGVGAASSEQVIVSNLLSSNGGFGIALGPIAHIPIGIPAGTRLAARCQATTTNAQHRVSILAWSPRDALSEGLSRCTTYGANTADSGGASIDPGASANTKGAWVELTSSTSAAHQALVLGIGNQANATRTTCSWLVDVGIGAAGSETVLLADYLVQCQATDETQAPAFSPLIPAQLPAGTRLAVRAACDITDATDRLFDAVLYLFS